MLNRALKKEGLRSVLPEGKRRYEWKEPHGYRKFFETHAGLVMHPFNVKLLMDHELGVEASYWKPTEMQLLDDYMKDVPSLTINYDTDKSVLQKEVAELKEETQQQNYVIEGLAEKEAEETEKKLTELEIQQEERLNQIQEMQEEFSNLRDITLNLYSTLGVEAPKNDNEIIKLPAPLANLETELHRLRSQKKRDNNKEDLMIY